MRRFLRWLREPEVIGPPGCPLMRRWTLFCPQPGTREEAVLLRVPDRFDYKLLVHHFLPNTEDVDPHDHPRPLWTLILKGGYLDLIPCRLCGGTGKHRGSDGFDHCSNCLGRGLLVGDEMTRGVFRYRPAEHRHVTKVSSAGAWTLCLMGPKKREWGFWRDGKLWNWMRYEQKFGLGFRCEGGNRVVEVHAPDGRGDEEPVLGECSLCGRRLPINLLVDRGDGKPSCPSCPRGGAMAKNVVVVEKHAPVGSPVTPSRIAAARRAQQEG
ncbi:MAG: hypothetical protein ACRDPE_15320 [Solirubrobacterales bacterium]